MLTKTLLPKNLSGILLAFGMLLIAASCDQCKEKIEEDPPPLKLDYMEVEEISGGAVLYLYGDFGEKTAAGRVYVGGQEMGYGNIPVEGILDWQSNLVKCLIPPVQLKGGHGAVYVANQGRKSNERTLNVWKGEIIIQRPDEGSIKKTYWINAILRADADPHKAVPYLFNPQSGFESQTKITYLMEGEGQSQYTEGDCQSTVKIHLGGASDYTFPKFPFMDRASEDKYFQSAFIFKDRKFNFSAMEVFDKDLTQMTTTVYSCPGVSTHVLDYSLYTWPDALSEITLELEPGTNAIKAGNKTSMEPSAHGFIWDNNTGLHHHLCSIQWPRMEPMYQ